MLLQGGEPRPVARFGAGHGLQWGDALLTPPQWEPREKSRPSSRGACVCVYPSDRAQTGRGESQEKTRRQVVMRVHKWLIKAGFLLVAAVKQF